MKQIIFILLSIFLISCSNKTKLTKTDGAFGLKFGEQISLDKNSMPIKKLGIDFYPVNVPKQVKFFNKYYVSLSPKSHLIDSIYAVKRYSYIECTEQQMAMYNILLEKYSNAKNAEYVNTFKFEGGFVLLNNCNPDEDESDLYIIYQSNKYGDISSKEKREMMKKSKIYNSL